MIVMDLDVIVALNFILDGFLLILTALILRLNWNWWRILCSAILGSMYIVFMLIPQMSFSLSILSKIVLSIFMVWIAFSWHGPRECIKRLLVFYFLTCLLGGVAYATPAILDSQQSIGAGLHAISGNLIERS